MSLDTTGPNAEQVRYWNETAAPKWLQYQTVLDTQLEGLGRMTMDRARLASGERVLDVGCGCGATSRALAARVGPSGSVHGVDISAPMLERATALASEGGPERTLQQRRRADLPLEPAAPTCSSRFGVMFFADPPAAGTRHAARPGGRVAFVRGGRSPRILALVPLGAAAQHMQPRRRPRRRARRSVADWSVRGILDQAGFDGIKLEPVNDTLTVGGAGLTAGTSCSRGGSTGARDADPAVRPRVFAAVREALAPFVTPEGVRMPAAAWIVTATSPGA
jgi:SAM-dependent methyltransferase